MSVSEFTTGRLQIAITISGLVITALYILTKCCCFMFSRFRRSRIAFRPQFRESFYIKRTLGGLEPCVVSLFPTIKYKKQIFVTEEDNLCIICLGDFKEAEALRILPSCGHAFHVSCVGLWLRQNHTCPVCRVSLRAEWTKMSASLISHMAKSRFIPGALPECLFEQTKMINGVNPMDLQSTVSAINVTEADPEIGESSNCIFQPSVQSSCEHTQPVNIGEVEPVNRGL